MSDLSDAAREREWLTMAQAADRLGVSPPTLRRWAAQGRIPSTRTLGGHRRIALRELPTLVPPEVPVPPRPGEPPSGSSPLPQGHPKVADDAAQLRAERDRLTADLAHLRRRLTEEQASVQRLTRELHLQRRQLSEAARAQSELRQVILRLVTPGDSVDQGSTG
jgi:excisionase family DNA binding protein